jgi:excisionase family DNA binding protein
MKDSLVAMVVAEMLVQGIHFDSQSMWKMPIDRNQVWRAFRALINSGVIEKLVTIKGRYRFTQGFLEALKQDITKEMPRGVFLHYPDLGIFDISGMEYWTEDEFERYVKRQRKYWVFLVEQHNVGIRKDGNPEGHEPLHSAGGERMYSVIEVARVLHVTTRAIYKWAKSGRIRLVGPPRKRRITETELRRLFPLFASQSQPFETNSKSN